MEGVSKIPLIEYLTTVDTPTLSNAIELLNIRPRAEGFCPTQNSVLVPRTRQALRARGHGSSSNYDSLDSEDGGRLQRCSKPLTDL
jgi:hypothetical protein